MLGKRRFVKDLISLGIQGISTLLNHRKQNKLQKGMKHLLMRQEVLNNKIIALEDDMMSLTKATLSGIRLFKKRTGINRYVDKKIKKTKKIKILELEISRNSARIADNSNAIVFLSGTISILLSEMERYLALY